MISNVSSNRIFFSPSCVAAVVNCALMTQLEFLLHILLPCPSFGPNLGEFTDLV